MPCDPKLVQSLFLRAVELPTPERSRLLELECAGDSELRKSIEAFLAAHDQPDDFLDVPLPHAAPDHTLPENLRAEPEAFVADARAGPYKLVEVLGEGGMGTVWVAEQEAPIKRRVALKIIKMGMASAYVIRRFQQERQALALMDHPNIAKILDAGVTGPHDRPYFAMELIKGVPITTYCDELRLSVRERLELFLPVCRAIEHAHQKGIIHRDIKPGNVLVCIPDGRPVPKVIDFGIAKAVNQRLADDAPYTGVGVMVGSLQYMAPEQADLGALDVDTRADVYGLGVLLYELLTGTPPIEAAHIRTVPFLETLRMIREQEPPAPSTRLGQSQAAQAARRRTEPARLAKQLRGELDWIVMKCLEKDRTRRYESTAALARDVERHLRDEPVEAGPPSAAYRARKFVRRNLAAVIAAGALFASLAVGVVGTTAGMVWAVDERRAARKAEGQEREARVLAERRLGQLESGADILASIFGDMDPRAVEREGKSLREILGARLDAAAARLDGEAVGDPLTVARLQHALGSSYLGLGYPKKALVLLERARRTREELLGPRDPATLATAHALAVAYRDAGRLKEAVALFEDTLRSRRDVLTPTHRHTLAAMNNLAVAYHEVGRLSDALREFREVHRLTTDARGESDEDTLTTKSNLAAAYLEAGRVREAIRLFEETLRDRKTVLNADHPDVFRSMSQLAAAYLEENRVEEARELSEEALRRRRVVLGSLHPETIGSMGEVAVVYRRLDRLDDAARLGEEALKLWRETLSLTHPRALWAMNTLASTYWDADRPGDAMRLFVDVFQAATQTLGADHPDTLRAMCNVASGHRDAGDLAKAIPLFVQARKGMRKTFDHEHIDLLTCTANLISAYLAAGQVENAIPLLNDLLVQPREPQPSDLRRAKLLAQVGFDLVSEGRPGEAEPLLRECLAIRERWEPNAWTTRHAELLLGCSFLEQGNLAAAEGHLLRGYEGLKRQAVTLPAKGKALLPDAAHRLVELYAARGKPFHAVLWRAEWEKHKVEIVPPPRAVRN